jgi:hypothetical protein
MGLDGTETHKAPANPRRPDMLRRPDISTLSLAARRQVSSSNGTDMRVSSGIAIPPHMNEHGQEGFRTPTGEDYEEYALVSSKNKKKKKSRSELESPLATPQQAGHRRNWDGSFTGGLERLRVQVQSPHDSEHVTPRGSPNRSRLSMSAVTEMIEGTIKWRVRIRHYTWTFFTMTMATGGIANVLYSGPCGSRSCSAVRGTVA